MRSLYLEEELHLQPTQGVFDVAQVAEAIAGIGFSFRDETDPAMFVVCPDEECRQVFSQRRREHPERGFPYMLLIHVTPERVVINQFAGPEFAPFSEQFVTWLTTKYPCQASNEMGKDLTAELPGTGIRST